MQGDEIASTAAGPAARSRPPRVRLPRVGESLQRRRVTPPKPLHERQHVLAFDRRHREVEISLGLLDAEDPILRPVELVELGTLHGAIISPRLSLAARAFQPFEDVGRRWEAADGLLGKDQPAVDAHIEDAAVALDEFNRQTRLLLERSLQPGGLREVVSTHAVFDGQVHTAILAGARLPRADAGNNREHPMERRSRGTDRWRDKMTQMSAHPSIMTADELLRLPSGTWRYELISGELRRMTPAGHVHGMIAARVGARLLPFVEEHGLGEVYAAETGFLLRRSPDTVRAPDAAFVSQERLASMTLQPEGYFPGPPDFAVEVLSPSDTDREVIAKIADWLDCGCRAVLVLDPVDRTARLHRPGRATESFTARDVVTLPDLLPGWSLGLADLFR